MAFWGRGGNLERRRVRITGDGLVCGDRLVMSWKPGAFVSVAASHQQVEAHESVSLADSIALISRIRDDVDARLAVLLPDEGRAPSRLHAAMRYSVLSPGKRLRPVITALVARQCGGNMQAALDAGCAVEMVHAASLVIDDLPAMDDAELRRARPTTHRTYGEATGILAAISVMNLAYDSVARLEGVSASNRARLITLFADAIGPEGLAGGQEYDVNGAAGASEADIESVNRRKTGALFSLAAQAGACMTPELHDPGDAAHEARLGYLAQFGNHLGLAFQTLDDIMDATGTTLTGKDRDQDGGKPTIARVEGLEAAHATVKAHVNHALAALEAGIGEAPHMRALAGAVFDTALQGAPSKGYVPDQA